MGIESVRQHRLAGRNQEAVEEALEWIKQAPVGVPAWCSLVEDLSICAYYVEGRMSKYLGMLACEALVARRGAPEQTLANTVVVASWYARELPVLNRGAFVQDGDERLHGYHPCNPCIIDADTMLACIRTVNYRQERGRCYRSDDPDGVIRTRNYIYCGALGDEVVNYVGYWWVPDSEIRGLEDMRVIRIDNEAFFTATSCQVPDAPVNVNFGQHARWPRVVAGLFDCVEDEFYDCDHPEIGHLVPLRFGGACEKNWIPFDLGSELAFVYSWDPFVVLRPDLRTGECRPEWNVAAPCYAKSWRGGTPGYRYPSGVCLAIVHEVARLPDRNVYTHRLVEWDGARITRYSEPFVFEHHGIEYACGLARKQNGDWIVSYGVEDREAKWCEVADETIELMLSTAEQAVERFQEEVG
jgi:hypothetical protein